MTLKLRYYGDPILRKRSEPIGEITEEIKQLARDMVAFSDANNGIGLSAVQIGILLRLFVLRNYVVTPDDKWSFSAPLVFINPKVVFVSDETEGDDEACLSLPKTRGWVVRPVKVRVEALDINGNPFVDETGGVEAPFHERLNARVRLHENDHLNGVLYPDRMDAQARKELDPVLREIKKKYS